VFDHADGDVDVTATFGVPRPESAHNSGDRSSGGEFDHFCPGPDVEDVEVAPGTTFRALRGRITAMSDMGGVGGLGEWDFFLSYADADADWAHWLTWALESAGFHVNDRLSLTVPGSNPRYLREQGLVGARRTIAILSASYLDCDDGQAEWQVALDGDPLGLGRRLIPVRIENCSPAGRLGGVDSIDLFGLPATAAQARLVGGVHQALLNSARPAAPPPYPGPATPEPSFPGPAASDVTFPGSQPSVSRPTRLSSSVQVASRRLRRPARLGSAAAQRAVTASPSEAPAVTAGNATPGLASIRWRATLGDHAAAVQSVAFSPDGTVIATGSGDGTARLWDGAGTACAMLDAHRDAVRLVLFSPDGSLLATCSADGSARLWDSENGECRATLEGRDGEVWSAAFAPDGSRLATGSADGIVRLWDVPTGIARARLTGTPAVWAMAFSPDSASLITGSVDGALWWWDAATGGSRAARSEHRGEVWSVVVSPDGTALATASVDGTARLWDAATREPRATLKGHAGQVLSVVFSPDGALLATRSVDRTVRLWRSADGAQRASLVHEGQVSSMAVSPDGSLLATGSGDGSIRLWDVATGTVRAVATDHTDDAWSMAFSPDGPLLVTGSRDGTARLWAVE
jgi:WD40 repeat protein